MFCTFITTLLPISSNLRIDISVTMTQTGTTMIGEYSEAHLLKTAKNAVAKKTKDSTVLDKNAEDRIPKFGEDGKSVCLVCSHQ